MKSEIKEISPTQKEIQLQIDTETIKAAYGKVSQKYAKRASVPGFRKGYAPLDIVRLRFKDDIKNEVLQEILPNAVTEALQEHDLHPLAEPRLHIEDHENLKVSGTVPISLQVQVEVMPEIPDPKYDEIDVIRRLKPVLDGEVEDLIAERLQKEAVLIPVEGRRSELGDTVIVDLEGIFEGEPYGEPIRAEDVEIVLGDEIIEKSFTDNLIGVLEDDKIEFTVSYPDTFSSETLAGKTVQYNANIKSVGTAEIPKLDDEWVQSLDEGHETLADLRIKLKTDLEKLAEADADARLRNNAIAKLIENNLFEVPDTLIENQARNLLNNFALDMQQRGIDVNTVEPAFIEMAYNNMRTQAERDIRGAMLLDKVSQIEKVAVEESDIEEEISRMSEYYRSSAEEIRESLEKQGGGVENIRNNLKTRKAIEAVVAKAKITEGDWVDESLGETQAEEKPKKTSKANEPEKKAANEGG